MKKTLLFAVLFSLSSIAAAAGEYDGVWAYDVPFNVDYISLHQNGVQILAAGLDAGDGDWEAFRGTIAGSVIEFELFYSGSTPGSKATGRINFSSLTTGIVTVLSCTPGPGSVCTVTPGTQIPIKKIF